MTAAEGESQREVSENPPGEDGERARVDGETSSPIFDVLELGVAGACITGLYQAGQAGQFWTAFFIGTTLIFIYYERHHRKQLDSVITG